MKTKIFLKESKHMKYRPTMFKHIKQYSKLDWFQKYRCKTKLWKATCGASYGLGGSNPTLPATCLGFLWNRWAACYVFFLHWWEADPHADFLSIRRKWSVVECFLWRSVRWCPTPCPAARWLCTCCHQVLPVWAVRKGIGWQCTGCPWTLLELAAEWWAMHLQHS